MYILEYQPSSTKYGRGAYCLFDPQTDDVLFYVKTDTKTRKELEDLMFSIKMHIYHYDPEQIRILVEDD